MRLPPFQFLPPEAGESERDDQFWRDIETSTRLRSPALVESFIAALCFSRALVETAHVDDSGREAAAKGREAELRALVAARGYGDTVPHSVAA